MKKLQLTIYSDDITKVKSFSISKGLLTLLSFLELGIILSLFLFIFLFAQDKVDQRQLISLKESNQYLKERMKGLECMLDSMNLRLKQINEQDKKIRKLEGMSLISDEFRKLGTGGVPYYDTTFISTDFELFELNNRLLTKLEKVKRCLNFEVKSYDEIYNLVIVKQDIYDNTPSILPAYGRFSDRYGYRIHPIYHRRMFHNGFDIAGNKGDPIYATADGEVVKVAYSRGLGRYIKIKHGYGYSTVYGHLNKALVRRGDKVKKGQIIAEMGRSGIATGTHLHYEVHYYGRSRNPFPYFYKQKSSIKVAKKYILSLNK